LDDPEGGASFGEAVYLSSIRDGNGDDIGLVVSSGYGHRVGKSIAYGVVEENALSGDVTGLHVNVLGRKRMVSIVEAEALYDAGNEKVRA